MVPTVELPSTRPYLIRALHHWCSDHGYTPFLAVAVDGSVRVPMEHVRDGQIVLNLSHEATQGLDLGNETIAFKARFGGVAREIRVPVERVLAIYARENGQGMAFPVGASAGELTHAGAEAAPDTSPRPQAREVDWMRGRVPLGMAHGARALHSRLSSVGRAPAL
jgi:stringent starvation protein B